MRVLACALLFACPSALPQMSTTSPDVLLTNALTHIRETIAALPNYTCTETIDRERQTPTTSALQRIDLVRLEVARTGDKELFAWPGARKFEDRPVSSFVGGGLIGDGTFGLFTTDIFVNGMASMKAHGPELLQARETFRIGYVVRPTKKSVFTLVTALGSAAVGYSGSFWIDPESLDLIRLDIAADSIPVRLQLVKARMSVEYGVVKAGSRNIVLPRSSVIEFVYRSGAVSRDDIEFARCREFAGRTNIVFDGEEPARPVSAAGAEEPRRPAGATFVLPGGLRMPLRLQTSIDAGTASVGDEISAIVEEDVKDQHRVWLAKGSVVRGRIRRLELRRKEAARARPSDGYVFVGLEFTTADAGHDTAEFVAELQSIRMAEVELTHVEKEESKQWVTGAGNVNVSGNYLLTRYRESFDRLIPGVGYLYITSEPFRLSAGLPMVWQTEALREADR